MEWSISLPTLIAAGVVISAVVVALVFGKYEPGTLLHALGQGVSKLILCGLIFWSGWGAALHFQLNGLTASVAPTLPVETAECMEARSQLESLRADYDQLLDAFEPTPKKVARR